MRVDEMLKQVERASRFGKQLELIDDDDGDALCHMIDMLTILVTQGESRWAWAWSYGAGGDWARNVVQSRTAVACKVLSVVRWFYVLTQWTLLRDTTCAAAR